MWQMAGCPAYRCFDSDPKYANAHLAHLPWQIEHPVWCTLPLHTKPHCLCPNGPLISAVICPQKHPAHKECLPRSWWWAAFHRQKTWGWSIQAAVLLGTEDPPPAKLQRALLCNLWHRRLEPYPSCGRLQTPAPVDRMLLVSFRCHAIHPVCVCVWSVKVCTLHKWDPWVGHTWHVDDRKSHNLTVWSSDEVMTVSLTGDISTAMTLCPAC